MVNKKEYNKIRDYDDTNSCLRYITSCLAFFGCIKLPTKQPKNITDDEDWVTIDEFKEPENDLPY